MLRSSKRSVVFAPEGYHPVKVARTVSSKKMAGETVLLGNTGAGCAIDNIDPEDGAASLQTRGLVSVAVHDGDGDERVESHEAMPMVRVLAGGHGHWSVTTAVAGGPWPVVRASMAMATSQ